MINIDEVMQLLYDQTADNIICRDLDFKPTNLAMFIAAIANSSSEFGYILIGANKNTEGHTINGISRSFKIDGVIRAALNQLSFQPSIEYQMCSLEGKYVYVIYVKKSEQDIHFGSVNTKENPKFTFSKEELLNDLFLACVKLQRNHHYKNVSEDERNDFIRDLLETNDYQVKDQTRQGTSNSGKASGEVDILVHEKGFPCTIIEALNLSSLNTSYLDTHIDKIYKYDTTGNEYNFILSYVEVKDFGTFWTNYCDHIKKHKYPYDLIGIDENIGKEYDYSDIRLVMTKHNRYGKETRLIHICVKIQS